MRESGWLSDDGEAVTADALHFWIWDALRPLTTLGMLEVAELPKRDVALTDFGWPTAAEVLWRRATRPGF